MHKKSERETERERKEKCGTMKTKELNGQRCESGKRERGIANARERKEGRS